MTSRSTSTTPQADVEALHRHLVLTELELEARRSAIVKVDTLEQDADFCACAFCGCTNEAACWPPCSWIAPDRCSACGGRAHVIETIGHALQAAAAENA